MKYIISLIILSLCCAGLQRIWNSEYFGEKDYPCYVIGKGYTTSSKGGYTYILRTTYDNHTFDINVTPETYTAAKEGETLYFSLCKDQVYGDTTGGWLSVLFLVLAVGAIVSTVYFIIQIINR